MRRIIVDYKKLTNEILKMISERYPDGYNDNDIIVFRNKDNEIIEAIEVKTEDTIYLVKISDELVDSMENFYEEEEEDIIERDLEIDLDLNLKVPIEGDENDDLDNDDLDIDDNGEDYYNEDDDIDDEEESLVILSLLMMTLLERARG